MTRWMGRLLPALVGLAVAACGGGGGGGDSGGGATEIVYPSVVQGGEFSFPSTSAVPSRTVADGQQRGLALVGSGLRAGAGLRVELLDASDPAAPVVVSKTTTDADGGFKLADGAVSVAAHARWIRVTLADGSRIRAFATGWTEVSPGTELAVGEIQWLAAADAFEDRALSVDDVDAAQRSAALWWQGQPGRPATPKGLSPLRDDLRVHAPWNDLLANLAAKAPSDGAGDVAGLMPPEEAAWPSTVLRNGRSSRETLRVSCFKRPDGSGRDCSLTEQESNDFLERLEVLRTGVWLRPGDATDAVTRVLELAGRLPLFEYAPVIGTQVLVDEPRLAFAQNNVSYRAAAKVTRRTYPVETIAALGTEVAAFRVEHDYEIAVLDVAAQRQTDLLVRETRWFSPGRGRVRYEGWGAVRDAGSVSVSRLSAAADSVSGVFFADPVRPFAGRFDVHSLALRHLHAVPVPSLDLVYVGTEKGQGTLLELDGTTLATQRSLALPALPRRLAASADGTRVYAGLDGGSVAEIDTAAWRVVRRFTLPPDESGRTYDRVFDLAVDPFDASRVLVLAGSSRILGTSGTVFAYRSGNRLPADGPTGSANYGWDHYGLTSLAWSGAQDQWLGAFTGDPMSQYRFALGATGATELASELRVDDVGVLEQAGQILTGFGRVLRASDFTPLRQLSVAPFGLKDCLWAGTGGALCSLGMPYMVRLDAATGSFSAAYLPAVQAVASACDPLDETVGASFSARITIDARRSLVAGPPKSEGHRCTLQVWTLRGVPG